MSGEYSADTSGAELPRLTELCVYDLQVKVPELT